MQRQESSLTKSSYKKADGNFFNDVSDEEIASFKEKYTRLLAGPAKFRTKDFDIRELDLTYDVIKNKISLDERRLYIEHQLTVLRDYKACGLSQLALEDNDSHALAIEIGDSLCEEDILTRDEIQELSEIFYDCAQAFFAPQLNYELFIDCAKLSKEFRIQLSPLSNKNLYTLLTTTIQIITADIRMTDWPVCLHDWSQLVFCLRDTFLNYREYYYDNNDKMENVGQFMLGHLLKASHEILARINLEDYNKSLEEAFEYMLDFCKQFPDFEVFVPEIKRQYSILMQMLDIIHGQYYLVNEIDNLQTEMDNLYQDKKYIQHFEITLNQFLTKKIARAEHRNAFEKTRHSENYIILKNYTELLAAKYCLNDLKGAQEIYDEASALAEKISSGFFFDEDMVAISEFHLAAMIYFESKGRKFQPKCLDECAAAVRNLISIMYPSDRSIRDMVSATRKLFALWIEAKMWDEMIDFSRGILESCGKRVKLYLKEEVNEDEGMLACFLLMNIVGQSLQNLPTNRYNDLTGFYHLLTAIKDQILDYDSRFAAAKITLGIMDEAREGINAVNDYLETVDDASVRIPALINYLHSIGTQTSNGFYIFPWKIFVANPKLVKTAQYPAMYFITPCDIADMLANRSFEHGLYQVLKRKIAAVEKPKNSVPASTNKSATVVSASATSSASSDPSPEMKSENSVSASMDNAATVASTSITPSASSVTSLEAKPVAVASSPAPAETKPTPAAPATLPKASKAEPMSVKQWQELQIKRAIQQKKEQKMEIDRLAELARAEAEEKKLVARAAFAKKQAEKKAASQAKAAITFSPPAPAVSPRNCQFVLTKPTKPGISDFTDKHAEYLNAALTALANLKMLHTLPNLTAHASMQYYASLYNMAQCQHAFQSYMQLSKNADEKKQADNHKYIQNFLASTVMAVAQALTRDFTLAKPYSVNNRKELVYKLGLSLNAKYVIEEYPLMLQETRLYKELKDFYATTPQQSPANPCPDQLQIYISQIFDLFKKMKEDSHTNDLGSAYELTPKKRLLFLQRYSFEMQAVSVLVTLCGELLSQLDNNESNSLKSFLQFCNDQKLKIHDEISGPKCFYAFVKINASIQPLESRYAPEREKKASVPRKEIIRTSMKAAIPPLTVAVPTTPSVSPVVSAKEDVLPAASPTSVNSNSQSSPVLARGLNPQAKSWTPAATTGLSPMLLNSNSSSPAPSFSPSSSPSHGNHFELVPSPPASTFMAPQEHFSLFSASGSVTPATQIESVLSPFRTSSGGREPVSSPFGFGFSLFSTLTNPTQAGDSKAPVATLRLHRNKTE